MKELVRELLTNWAATDAKIREARPDLSEEDVYALTKHAIDNVAGNWEQAQAST